MLVILAIAAVAILACVVLVSLGRGGELTEFPPDVPPLDLPEAGQLTAVDFMALQLPVNLVGYHTQSVDETLRRAAGAISARDTRIAVLEQRVSELLSSRLYARQEVYAAPGAGPRTEHEPEAPAAPRELPESGDPVPAGEATATWEHAAQLKRPPEWRVAQPGGTAARNGEAHDAAAQDVQNVDETAAKADDEPATDTAQERPDQAAGQVGEAAADDVKAGDEKAGDEKAGDEKADETVKLREQAPDGGADEPRPAGLSKDGDERP
ncbi:hypothetical protein ACGFJC_45195 [Nonomuraea fuscirosea]|uniref:hypothetical protein n=1 Tax=Nonomuraea fuscirosea TaxID=1291556 RepID=UPI003428C164